MTTPSSSRSWPMPTENTATNWDAELNTLFDDYIESACDAIETTANAAMPKAGGTMTGNLKTLTQTGTVVNSGNLTGAVTFDCATANTFYGTVTGNVTSITTSNLPTSGTEFLGLLELTNGAAFTITWPAAWKWDGGTSPTLQSSGVDMILFITRDGGTTVRAVHFYSNTS